MNRAIGSLECGDKSPLLDEATCRLVQKRGHARALQRRSQTGAPAQWQLRHSFMSNAQMEIAFAAWPQVEPANHVPRTEREYRQLVTLLDRLVDEVGEQENHPLASLMDVLGVLIEKYEDDHVAELA